MKLLWTFSLAFLVSGIECFKLGQLKTSFQLGKPEGQLVLSTKTSMEEFLAPLKTVQTDLKEIYGRTKSNDKTKGFEMLIHTGLEMLIPDDCLALSNKTQIAYDLAVNATEFVVTSVEEITSSLNELVSCPSTSFLPDRVIKCMFDQLQIVRQEILDTDTKFASYKTQAVQLYSQIVYEINGCVSF